jgi:hypothetical protein
VERFWSIFDGIKRIITFALGVVIIVDALNDRSHVVAKLLIGTALIGLLPLGDLLRLDSRPGRSANR